jgi:hypothetical protein
MWLYWVKAAVHRNTSLFLVLLELRIIIIIIFLHLLHHAPKSLTVDHSSSDWMLV